MFTVDERILATSFELTDWPLSRIFLKDHADYPWLILIPRVANLQELMDLNTNDQQQLMKEITALSTHVKNYFNPDKMNIGTLGNIVSQLHIHVVGRYQSDPLWPHGIWQENLSSHSMPLWVKKKRISELTTILSSHSGNF